MKTVRVGRQSEFMMHNLKQYDDFFADMRVEEVQLHFERRLTSPKNLFHRLMESLQKGHLGQNLMLASVLHVCRSKISGRIVFKTKTCKEFKD